ncbi:hypothetical protein ED92_10990 [Amycolatopsis sp. MJM2582]|nr:hypothetical protein ED92_10990 [Amycolatopsis sp. MJM2582]
MVNKAMVRLGPVEIPDVAVLFAGPGMGMQRRYDPGWGALIEVAGVVRMLEAIAAGEVSADRARQALVGLAERSEQAWLADSESDFAAVPTSSSIRCTGDCPDCEAARPEFDAHNAEIQRRVDRARHLDRYPFAVSKSSIHTSSCNMARQGLTGSPHGRTRTRDCCTGTNYTASCTGFRATGPSPVFWSPMTSWRDGVRNGPVLKAASGIACARCATRRFPWRSTRSSRPTSSLRRHDVVGQAPRSPVTVRRRHQRDGFLRSW